MFRIGSNDEIILFSKNICGDFKLNWYKEPTNTIEAKNLIEINVLESSKILTAKVNYTVENSRFFKSIPRAYWSNKYKNWVITYHPDNIKKLQNQFLVWPKNDFEILYEKAIDLHDPSIVILYQSPEYLGRYLIPILF